jgi:hypothetical protein
VTHFRRSRPITRLLLAAVLALWLGVRLLTPVGFMPSFAGGSLTIVECPEADGAPPPMAMPDMPGMDMAGMAMPAHDHAKSGFHQLCPYAEAASLAGIAPGAVLVALLVVLAALAPQARALLAFPLRPTRDRPPSQGPPFPA